MQQVSDAEQVGALPDAQLVVHCAGAIDDQVRARGRGRGRLRGRYRFRDLKLTLPLTVPLP